MAKKKKEKEDSELEGSINLDGEILKYVIQYDTLRNERDSISNKLEEIRGLILGNLKFLKIKSMKSQLYSVSHSVVQPADKLAEKKLKEILFARKEQDLWNSCLYKPDPYDKLDVRKRKGGENIF